MKQIAFKKIEEREKKTVDKEAKKTKKQMKENRRKEGDGESPAPRPC